MAISRKQATVRGVRTADAKPDAADEPRDSGNDFGVLSHNHTHKHHERGIGLGLKPHPNRMTMQAAPDHGDHE